MADSYDDNIILVIELKLSWLSMCYLQGEGAYRGLFERKGNCFVYASLSKRMLDRAGISNMIIMFSNSRMTHYWNLINLVDAVLFGSKIYLS